DCHGSMIHHEADVFGDQSTGCSVFPALNAYPRERARRGLQAHGGGVTDPDLVARAEHEVRGAAAALALACENLRRDPATGDQAAMIEAQLDRIRAGLEDLEAARGEVGGRVSQLTDVQ